MIVLPDVEDHTIISHSSGQNTGTWRTDGQTARGYYSGLHCEQCGRAV